MTALRRALCGLVLAASLFACTPPPNSGTVIGRDDDDPEHEGWIEVDQATFDRFLLYGHYPDPR